MLHEHYLELLDQVDRRIASLDAHPDARVREEVVELLRHLDLLHREGLVRLVAALRADGAGDQLGRATADPVVRILLGLYGLADLELPEEAPAESGGSLGFFPAERLTSRRRAAGGGGGQP